jgi:hypothetical protein
VDAIVLARSDRTLGYRLFLQHARLCLRPE